MCYVDINFSRSTAGTGNIVFQLDYVFVSNNDVVGNPNGGSTAVSQTTGAQTFAVSATSRGYSTVTMNVDLSTYVSGDTVWFKLYRLGSNGSDTYTQSIYVSGIVIRELLWNVGSYFE